jgi:FkbM family methyltransferase
VIARLPSLVPGLAFALILALAGCEGGGVNPNVIDEALLRPVLLKEDRQEVQAYMARLPVGAYQVYRVDKIGRFHVDDDNDMIKRTIMRNEVWDWYLVELFPKYVKPDSIVIDAGAHIGFHTVSFAKLVGAKGRVYAFEPQRKLYRELVFNLRLNGIDNVVPLRYALGQTAGVIEMDRAVVGNEGATQVGGGGDRAELRTLDSFGLRNVSLIKIDVESYEDFVLEGARLTIARSRPVILIEIMGGHQYESAPPEVKAKIDGTRARLAQMGYKVQKIFAHDYVALPQ